MSRDDKGKFQKKKADPLYIKAVVAYYSKQCNLREINTFLFSVTNYQEHPEKQYISQTVECLDLCAGVSLPKHPSLPSAL